MINNIIIKDDFAINYSNLDNPYRKYKRSKRQRSTSLKVYPSVHDKSINQYDISDKYYEHDIGKWALVKFCGYPLTILNNNNKNIIPPHVFNSLK